MQETKVLDHGFVRLVDSMGNDLSVVRAARVSYDAAWRAGEDEGSDQKLIRYLWKHKHTTPFEAVEFQFDVMAPIFVFRQWHRHRTACLAADTMITFELPARWRSGKRGSHKISIENLFRKWQPTTRSQRPQRQTNAFFPRSRVKKMLLRVYDETTKTFTVGSISDVVCSGTKPIYEIKLENNKTLRCTRDHRLLTTEGWRTLADAVGLIHTPGGVAAMARKCHVLCNGVPVYQDRDWLQSHRQSGLSVADIAERGGCSYHTVRKWLRRHDLNFLPEERNFKNGNKPWNDGVSGYHTSRVVTEAEKATIRKARSGPQSNFWQGGITPERALIGAWTTANAHMVHARNNFRCATCGSKKRLETHHIKPVVTHPHLARDVSNLTTLCRDCHHSLHGRTGGEMRRARGGGPLLAHPSQIISIRYLGEQPTYDISVAGQHHNFVADGLVVHNSINELSARYRELPEIYYLPEPENVGAQSTSSKQARDLTGERRAERAVEIACVEQHCQQAFTKYRELLASGWPRELARMVLPLNTYSHMFWKVNLRNLFHFMTLRSDAHAQHEIRVYSDAMRELIRPIVPISVAAWET